LTNSPADPMSRLSLQPTIAAVRLSLATIDNKACLRLQGDVSLANSGGFIQAALDIEATAAADASSYAGLSLEVYGNDQEYNVHLRIDGVWLPWQSYRASFRAPGRWQTVRLPFDQFTAYRIGKNWISNTCSASVWLRSGVNSKLICVSRRYGCAAIAHDHVGAGLVALK